MANCHVCKKGPLSNPPVNVYRQNKPGEVPAVWACKAHNGAKIDPAVKEIVGLIEGDNRPRAKRKK